MPVKKKLDSGSAKFSEAVKRLRLARGQNLESIASDVGVTRTSQFRYETGDMIPDTGVMFRYLRLALSKPATETLACGIAAVISERASLAPFAVTLAALATLEGPDAPKHITRLAKRAAELVG